MKKPGLIGGASWHSTISYLEIMCAEYERRLGNVPEIDIQGLSLKKLDALQKKKDWEGIAELIAYKIKLLKRDGADFAAICSNTLHIAYDMVRDYDPDFRILNIADETAEAISQDGYSKVGLLGTRRTMEEDYFRKAYAKHGIDLVVPDKERISVIDHVIWHELVKGEVRRDSRDAFKAIIHRLKFDEGIQAVILGCTEISLLVKPEHSPVKTYDTAAIHAKSIVAYSLNN
jgi:aspartate racemase